MDAWKKAQEFEKDWWSNCINTYGEEEKQLTYARKMGLTFFHNGKSPYNIDLKGVSVLDIGGSSSSLLLKCVNTKRSMVIDPLLNDFPTWVSDRYVEAGIIPLSMKGEDLPDNDLFDEVWIYNVLQHTEDPAKIIKNARSISKIIRLFEWIGVKDEHGHPHELTEKGLNEWLGGQGQTEVLNDYTLRGKCYFGVFKGDHYGQ